MSRFSYVLPNHMLLQMCELLPREAQGILACCNPIPPLVRQHQMELHRILTAARETPLVKVRTPYPRWCANTRWSSTAFSPPPGKPHLSRYVPHTPAGAPTPDGAPPHSHRRPRNPTRQGTYPIPPLVRQHQMELHRILTAARETPLVKVHTPYQSVKVCTPSAEILFSHSEVCSTVKDKLSSTGCLQWG